MSNGSLMSKCTCIAACLLDIKTDLCYYMYSSQMSVDKWVFPARFTYHWFQSAVSKIRNEFSLSGHATTKKASCDKVFWNRGLKPTVREVGWKKNLVHWHIFSPIYFWRNFLPISRTAFIRLPFWMRSRTQTCRPPQISDIPLSVVRLGAKPQWDYLHVYIL